MELGRGGGGGAACPLVVETPPTPSALLKTRESGARLGWRTTSLIQHPPTGPAPVIRSPLNPSSHHDNWQEDPLNPSPRHPALGLGLTRPRPEKKQMRRLRVCHRATPGAARAPEPAAVSWGAGGWGAGCRQAGGRLLGSRGRVRGGGSWCKRKFGARVEGGGGVEFRDGVGLLWIEVGSHPRVAEAGVAGALMLFRDRVPVRDSCVLRSCGGAEAGLTSMGAPPIAPLIPERKWGRGGQELGGGGRAQQVPTSTSQPPLPPHPTSPHSTPPPLAAPGPWGLGLKSARKPRSTDTVCRPLPLQGLSG